MIEQVSRWGIDGRHDDKPEDKRDDDPDHRVQAKDQNGRAPATIRSSNKAS